MVKYKLRRLFIIERSRHTDEAYNFYYFCGTKNIKQYEELFYLAIYYLYTVFM